MKMKYECVEESVCDIKFKQKEKSIQVKTFLFLFDMSCLPNPFY